MLYFEFWCEVQELVLCWMISARHTTNFCWLIFSDDKISRFYPSYCHRL